MAGELKHIDVGTQLSSGEWVATDTHVLDSGANGDLLYFNGVKIVRIPIGGANTILKAVGGIPTWSSAAAIVSRNVRRITVADSPYAVSAANDDVVEVDSSGGPVTVTMPTAAGNTGKIIDIKKVSSDSNVVTINPQGGQTVSLQANLTMDVQFTDITFYGSTATDWGIA